MKSNQWHRFIRAALPLICCLVLIGSGVVLARITIAAASGWIRGVQWLINRQVPNNIVPHPVSDRSGLVISYIIPPSDASYPFLFNRSWIYDNALAVISLSMERECRTAKNTLSALAGLLDAQGKLSFSYNTADDWSDPFGQIELRPTLTLVPFFFS